MTDQRTVVATDRAPAALGPYSQAIATAGMVFTAGQVGIDPAVGKIVATTVAEQTEQVLRNLQAVLEAAGTGFERVVKTTVFMTDLGRFAEMNAVYARFFAAAPPARSTVQVAALPAGALVEIECVAVR